MMERVPVVTNVTYVFQRSQPPNLIVTAEGQVPTLGWKDPVLVPRLYFMPPLDGIWEYDFFAHAPDPGQPTGQAVSTVIATHTWSRFEEKSIRGVRVFGSGTGVKEILFDENDAGRFIVIALSVSEGPKHKECQVIAEGAIHVATKGKVFGPASRSECENWKKQNCECTC